MEAPNALARVRNTENVYLYIIRKILTIPTGGPKALFTFLAFSFFTFHSRSGYPQVVPAHRPDIGADGLTITTIFVKRLWFLVAIGTFRAICFENSITIVKFAKSVSKNTV